MKKLKNFKNNEKTEFSQIEGIEHLKTFKFYSCYILGFGISPNFNFLSIQKSNEKLVVYKRIENNSSQGSTDYIPIFKLEVESYMILNSNDGKYLSICLENNTIFMLYKHDIESGTYVKIIEIKNKEPMVFFPLSDNLENMIKLSLKNFNEIKILDDFKDPVEEGYQVNNLHVAHFFPDSGYFGDCSILSDLTVNSFKFLNGKSSIIKPSLGNLINYLDSDTIEGHKSLRILVLAVISKDSKLMTKALKKFGYPHFHYSEELDPLRIALKFGIRGILNAFAECLAD